MQSSQVPRLSEVDKTFKIGSTKWAFYLPNVNSFFEHPFSLFEMLLRSEHLSKGVVGKRHCTGSLIVALLQEFHRFVKHDVRLVELLISGV